MLGFYNVSVILTYCGLSAAVTGIALAMDGRPGIAVALLMFSGICDMFDGTIARATKRSEDAKVFGIQIDSLCDLVCFGVLPAVIAHAYGVTGVLGGIVMALYVLAAVIRLGYFNVIEQKRQQTTDEDKSVNHGMPVTTAAYLIPIYVFVCQIAAKTVCVPGFGALLLVMTVLFVLDFNLKNPSWKGTRYVAAAVLAAAAVCAIIFLF